MQRDAVKFISFSILAMCIAFTGYVFAQDDAPPSGGVYKQVDPDGNVTYTDKPPSADAKAIKLPKGTEYKAPSLPAFTPSTTQQPKQKPFEYESLAITAPKNDEAITDNAGNIMATVSVQPALQSGHQIEFLLDGTSVAKGLDTSHQFVNLDRGTHQLTARIVDNKDEEVASTSITFHVMRHHI